MSYIRLITLLMLGPVLFYAAEASAAETVRVLVIDDLPGLTIHFPGPYDVKDESGLGVVRRSLSDGGFDIVLDENTPKGGIKLTADGFMISINEYSLTGVIEVKRNGNGLFQLVNELDVEDYVRAVVGSEMSPGWSIEALKAQAVAARTYALYRRQSASAEDYDLCATVNSQMFRGDAIIKDGPARAANETRGLVMYYKGRPVEAVYHCSCGGSTEDALAVWSNSPPYLVSRRCDCRKQSPYANWTKSYTAAELEGYLSKAGHRVKGLKSVEVSDETGTGRAGSVTLRCESGTVRLSGGDFRKALGYGRLPSTRFRVSGSSDVFVFTGAGSGHGVGMCQWGAKVMSDGGADFRRIISYYYPGTELRDMRDMRALGANR